MTPPATAELQIMDERHQAEQRQNAHAQVFEFLESGTIPHRKRQRQQAPPCSFCYSDDTFVVSSPRNHPRWIKCGRCGKSFKESQAG